MGDASSVRLAIAPEVTFGTNPGSGFQYLRFTNESLALAARNVQSAEIDPTRQPAGNVRVGKAVEGQIANEWSLVTPAATPTGFDLPISLAMMSSWSTIISLTGKTIAISGVSGGTFTLTDSVAAASFANAVKGQWLRLSGFPTNGVIWAHITTKTSSDVVVCEGFRDAGAAVTNEAPGAVVGIKGSMIRIGSTKASATIQREYSDLTVPEYALYTGCRFGTWSMGFSPEGIAGGSFGLRGKLQATSTSNGAGTPTAKWSTARINTTDSHFKRKCHGVFTAPSTALRIAELGFDFDNRLREDLEVGGSGPLDIGISVPTLSGRLTAYMQDGALIRDFEADTLSKLCWSLDDGTRQMVFTLPAIRYTAAPAVAEGNDSTLRVGAQWVAEPDSDGVAFQIDRMG